MTEALFASLRRKLWFRHTRTEFARYLLFGPHAAVVLRDRLYEESEVPTTHVKVGRLTVAWRHRG